MPGRDITVLASNFLLDLSYLLGEKLDRRAALRANHVVMTAPVVLMFIARNAVVKRNFAGQSATRQKLQRPVDRGYADARVVFLDQPVQFVDRKMFPGL